VPLDWLNNRFDLTNVIEKSKKQSENIHFC
jgi:hypothetical protein